LAFWAAIQKKLKKYTQNIEESLILDPSLGRRNFYLGRGLATPANDNLISKIYADFKKDLVTGLKIKRFSIS
jgi:hypothetical protein